jgi:aminomethyltransferase
LRALAPLASIDTIARLAYFEHVVATIAGVSCRIGRLGYTGERGFEIIAPIEAKQRLWDALAARARPAGWAAADILRIEAGFVLFLNEFRLGVTPEEAGLGRFAGASSTSRVSLTGFCAEGTPPVPFAPGDLRLPRPGEIAVTSAAISPHCGGLIGLGYVNRDAGAPIVDPSGRFHVFRLVAVPFVDPDKRRVRGPWSAALAPV